MATTKRKTKKKTAKRKPAARKKTTTKRKSAPRKRKPTAKAATVKKAAPARRPKAPEIDMGDSGGATELQMKGNRLVVRLARDDHPEIFELDRLIKQVHKVMAFCQRKPKARDVHEFLDETEKGLQIILRNHLEDAMRKYLD